MKVVNESNINKKNVISWPLSLHSTICLCCRGSGLRHHVSGLRLRLPTAEPQEAGHVQRCDSLPFSGKIEILWYLAPPVVRLCAVLCTLPNVNIVKALGFFFQMEKFKGLYQTHFPVIVLYIPLYVPTQSIVLKEIKSWSSGQGLAVMKPEHRPVMVLLPGNI